jgi:hypothetical protein
MVCSSRGGGREDDDDYGYDLDDLTNHNRTPNFTIATLFLNHPVYNSFCLQVIGCVNGGKEVAKLLLSTIASYVAPMASTAVL